MATLNVQDYGAEGDGSTNDYEAIHAALRDASPGDTVYVPSGTYNVYASGTLFNFNEYAEPITLEGDGEDTVIRAHRALSGPMVRTDGQEVTIRDMVFDGRRDTLGNYGEHGLVIWRNTTTFNGFLLENCCVENFPENGIAGWGRNSTYRWCTIRNNGLHGLGLRDDAANQPGFVIEHCLFEGNAQNHSGFYNLDTATGHIRVRDCVLRHASAGAMKTSTGGEIDVRYERVRIEDNGGLAYQSTAGDFGTVVFEDVVGDNNGRFRLSNINYEVEGHLLAKNSNEDGINISDGAQLVSADEVSTLNNNGYGIWGGPGQVDTYNHSGNTNGPGGSGLSIDTTTSDPQTDLDNVPTADEVGAWAKDDSDEADEEDETPVRNRGASITTAAGVMQTDGGALATGTVPRRVVENFERYAPDQQLADTGQWTNAGSYSASYEVTDSVSASGSQSLVVTGTSSYHAIQSLDGDGLQQYPSADCTIRIATYLEAGSHDIAFGVPADEDNYHNNCYRLRGGPLLGRNPAFKRSVDGEMETLGRLDSRFPAGTWLEHVVEFEATGSEVVLTYHGYAWNRDSGAWEQFESGTQVVDSTNSFADDSGVGLGTYSTGSDRVLFDNFRAEQPGDIGPPDWSPASENA